MARITRPHLCIGVTFIVSLLAAPFPERADPTAGNKTVRVAASERYRAGRLYRFLMGGGYRDLWQAKITLPVLDLARVGGGGASSSAASARTTGTPAAAAASGSRHWCARTP